MRTLSSAAPALIGAGDPLPEELRNKDAGRIVLLKPYGDYYAA